MLRLPALAVVALPRLAAGQYGGACVEEGGGTCSALEFDLGNDNNYMCWFLSCDGLTAVSAMCETSTCDDFAEEIIAVADDSIGIYHTTEGNAYEFPPESGSEEASNGCYSTGCYSAGSVCYDGWDGEDCTGFVSGLWYGMNIGGTTTSVFNIPYASGTRSVELPVTKEDVTYEDGDNVAVWWGVSVGEGALADTGYDLIYRIVQPYMIDYDGDAPTSGAYLQGGTWKSLFASSFDPSIPVTAAKASFGDGRSYYFSFFDKMVWGGVNDDGTVKNLVFEGNLDVYVDVDDYSWTFAFNTALVTEMGYFAVPLYVMCPGETDCFEDNSADRVAVVSAAGPPASRAAAAVAVAAGAFLAAVL